MLIFVEPSISLYRVDDELAFALLSEEPSQSSTVSSMDHNDRAISVLSSSYTVILVLHAQIIG